MDASGATHLKNGETAPVASNDGGRGDDTNLSPVQQNKIVSMTTHASRQEWPLTAEHERAAVAVVSRNLLNEDGRVSNGAVRNMIAMKGQNMKREEMDQAPKTVAHGVQVNVQANVQNSPAIGVDDIVQARQRIQEWRNERFAEPAEENEAANGTADAGRDPV